MYAAENHVGLSVRRCEKIAGTSTVDGQITPQSLKIESFASELGELAQLPIHLWDERLTSHEAHQILYEAGHERQTHHRLVDQVAATLILQSFLDEKRGTETELSAGE